MTRRIARLAPQWARTGGGSSAGSGSRATTDQLFRFERLLAELSARFINLPASRIDEAITDALRQIVGLLGVDRSQLIRFGPEPGSAFVTHSWAVDGVPVVSPHSLREKYPWGIRRIQSGEPVVVARLDDLPSDADRDKASWQRAGVKSNLTMPMIVAGRPEGALTFACLRRARNWPEALVARVRVLAEVFANALAHKRAQEALDAAMAFERMVSDVLASLLTAGRGDKAPVVEAGLRRMALALNAERATLWERVRGKAELRNTYRWLAAGVPTPPDADRRATLAWTSAQVVAGAVVRFARHDELPRAAAGDLPQLRKLGIRSLIMVPLSIAGDVAGALSFASVHEHRDWPEELVPRVMLLGDVFASLLARGEGERREREAKAQAIHAARVGSMGAFTASLAHELTQPLAAIRSNAETASRLLASPTPDIDELRSTLQDIVADNRRAADLIQKLRRYLRKDEAERTELELRSVTEEAVHFVRNAAADRGASLAVDVAQGLRIACDAVQIQQVLVNLLLNAFDAVADRADGKRKVAVIGRAEPGGASLEITDSGAGLDERTLSQIFEPFFTTKPGGMGLGLSISRAIVEAHGGALTVRSAPDLGTTFRIELPATPAGRGEPQVA